MQREFIVEQPGFVSREIAKAEADKPFSSCLFLASLADRRSILTLEGTGRDDPERILDAVLAAANRSPES